MSLDLSSGGDDSLVDVENHIREIESYLQSDASVNPSNPNPLMALAAPSLSNSRGRKADVGPPQHSPPVQSQPHNTSYSTLSSVQSTPRTMVDTHRSTGADSNASHLSSPSTVSTSTSLHSEMTEKERMVQQLLQRHRQAQATAQAANAAAAQPVQSQPVARATEAPTRPRQPIPVANVKLTSSAAPSLDRNQRDALVEQLLQERRKQREAVTTAALNAPPTAATKAGTFAEKPATTYSGLAAKQAVPISHHQQPNKQGPLSASSTLSSTYARSALHVQPAPAPPSTHHAHHHSSGSSSYDSETDSSVQSIDSSAMLESPHSNASHSRHTSRSMTDSPVDPRFAGNAQTIFEASEYINDDGTSIIHSNPATHRSTSTSLVEEEEEDHDHVQNDSVNHGEAQEFDPQKHRQQFASASSASVRVPRREPTNQHQQRSQSKSPRSSSTSAPRNVGGSMYQAGKAWIRPKTAAGGTGKAAIAATPKTASKKKQRPTSAQIPGSQSRYSREAILSEIERERNENFTFTPKLISKPLLSEDSTLEERLEVWTRRAEQSLARKLEQKKEYEEEKLAECTFAPKINPQSARNRRNSDGMPASERLFHEADQRQLIREKAKRMNEEELLSNMPFTPAISNASRKVASKKSAEPLYTRVASLQREKNENLQRALLDVRGDREKDSTFQPKINPVSMKLAQAREEREKALMGAYQAELLEVDQQEDGSANSPSAKAGQRLMSVSNKILEKKLQKAAVIQAHQDKACTFKPELNHVSEQLLKDNRNFQGHNKDFLTRQERMAEAARERELARQRSQEEMSEFSFKPDIGNASKVLTAAKKRVLSEYESRGLDAPTEVVQAALGTETKEQAIERLSVQETRALAEMKTKLRAVHEHQQGYTYKPEISNVSRILAQQRSDQLKEICGPDSNPEVILRQTAQTMLQAKMPQEFNKEHTFKPALNATSEEMVKRGFVESHYSHNNMAKLTASIEEDQIQKEKKRQEFLKRQQLKETQDCTFEPSIKRGVPKSVSTPSTVPIKGMQRFLQLKLLKKKQEEELAARERKVFMLDVYDPVNRAKEAAEPKVPYTVAQPFSLSHESRQAHRDAVRQKEVEDAEKEKMRECSFAPVTKQAQYRQMIQHILDEPDEL